MFLAQNSTKKQENLNKVIFIIWHVNSWQLTCMIVIINPNFD